MNIFKALSEGNGRISETNITSFMSYLLDSANELNNSFAILFFHLIDSITKDNGLSDLFNIRQNSVREQIVRFSSKFTITSEPEFSINIFDGSKQIPDILLRINSKITEEDVAFIIIENKINKRSIKKGQIEKQYEYFKRSEDYDESKPLYSVLITPNENVFKKIYNEAKDKNINTVWLKWLNPQETEYSIEAILRQLIKHEHNAEIEPIDPNTLFIIKSFIDYLANEFSKKGNDKKNYSYKGFNVVAIAQAQIKSKKYFIKRFSNNMVRLFDVNDKLLEIEVKPILRQIIEIYELEISLYHSTGKAKNTQVLGREIINKLNEK